MTTQNTEAAIRKSTETVVEVAKTRHGQTVKYDGRTRDAYVARSVHAGDIAVGMEMEISYRIEDGRDDSKFARVLEVHSVSGEAVKADANSGDSAEKAADEAKSFTAVAKSVKTSPAGLSIDFGHTHPAFASYHTLRANGVRIDEGDEVSGTFELAESERGKFARILSVTGVVKASSAESSESEESPAENTPANESAGSDVREFKATVKSVSKMRTGVELDLGYASPAYLAVSVAKGLGVSEGDSLSGTYRMEEGSRGKFARVLSVNAG